jgi:hypothetical protein
MPYARDLNKQSSMCQMISYKIYVILLMQCGVWSSKHTCKPSTMNVHKFLIGGHYRVCVSTLISSYQCPPSLAIVSVTEWLKVGCTITL